MQPIGAYLTEDGWAAYDSRGLTWRVDEDTAGEINATAETRREAKR
jgi:hypothetical protein